MSLNYCKTDLYEAVAVTLSQVPTSYFLLSSPLLNSYFLKMYRTNSIHVNIMCVAFIGLFIYFFWHKNGKKLFDNNFSFILSPSSFS